jgi:Bacteriophage CI repressor helix-turn-helix domain.
MDKSLILNRFKQVKKIHSDADLAEYLGITKSNLSNWRSRNSIDYDLLFTNCEGINLDWLINGEGEMLRTAADGRPSAVKTSKMIPFYDDVCTIGSCNSISASVDGCMPASEWIDAGDWFPEAGAAIRHYGDSMIEYPSGCILALKKVEDLRLILWGRNYCIETSEFRITKRLQSGEGDTIVAYSSNTDTYPDGRQIHEPKVIPMESIRSVWLVLGCVVKEYSSGAVFIRNKQ